MREENSELPEGWALATLDEISDVQWGNTNLTKKSYSKDGHVAFSASGPDGFLDHFEHEGEGIVLSAIGARCGRCFKADGKWTSIKNTITVCDFDSQIVLRDFLYPRLNDENRWKKKGGGQPFISLANARALAIPIPPVSEQRRIVEKIEALQERSGRARQALAEVGPLLEQFRQSVLHAAFTGRLTADWRAAHPNVEPAADLLARIRTQRRHRWEQAQLAAFEAKGKKPPKNWKAGYKDQTSCEMRERGDFPSSWTEIAFNELSDTSPNSLAIGPFGSNLRVKDYASEGVPLVFVREIRSECFGDKRTKFVNLEKADELKSHKVEPGDLLVTKMGDPPGDTAIYPAGFPDAIITADCIRLKPDKDLTSSKFLKYWFRTQPLREKILEETKGVAQRKLSLKRFREIRMPLPPIQEQLQIVGLIELAFYPIETILENQLALLGEFSQLNQSILAKAFRGELVPQDPNDEPASVLLERLRQQRQSAPKKKTTRRRKKTLADG